MVDAQELWYIQPRSLLAPRTATEIEASWSGGFTVHDRRCGSSIINKHVLARAVLPAQDDVEPAGPSAVQLAKPTVLIAVWVNLFVFLSQQLQGQMLVTEYFPIRGIIRRKGHSEERPLMLKQVRDSE